MSVMAVLATEAQHSALDPTLLLTWFTCLVTLGGFIVATLKFGRKFVNMLDDWSGESARPGVAHRPGVMERLAGLETSVEVIHAEVNYNHGGSIKDVVDRIEKDVSALHERLDKDDRNG